MAISNVLASGAPVFTSVVQGVVPDAVSAFAPIPFKQVVSDEYAAWNTSTSEFTAPVAGVYCVNTASRLNTVSLARIYVYKNGIQMGIAIQVFPALATDSASYTLYLKQGDVVDIRSDVAVNVDGGNQLCHLEISKVG